MKKNDWANQYPFNNNSSWPYSQPDQWSPNRETIPQNQRQPNQPPPFLLDPKNADIINGYRKFKATKYVVGYSLLVLLVLAGVVAAVFFAGRDAYQNFQLLQQGKEVSATVTRHYTSDCGDDGTCYYLATNYAVTDKNGKSQNYTREDSISADEYSRYYNGPVKVIYLPNEPTTARLILGKFNGFWSLALMAGIVLLAVLFGLGSVWGVRKAIASNIRLAKYGQILWGQLEKITGHEDDGTYTVKVTYAFANPSGYTLTGKTSKIRNDLNGKPLPWPGTPLYILYADDTTHKML